MRKKKEQPEGSFTEPAAAPRLSPLEIQSKEFGVTRVGGGYRMRDVDEFLDEVTNSMTAVVEENRRLKEQAGSGAMMGAPDLDEVARQADEIITRARQEASQILRDARASQPAPPAAATPGPGDRAAISAFLGREREFLQGLAGLVQGHAETVKGMARDARDAAIAASATPAPVAEPPPVPVPEPEPEARTEARTQSRAEPPERPEPIVVSEPETPAPAAAHEPAAPPAAPGGPQTEAMEEPVRIDEPEPATVGRTESEEKPEDGDRSLRDLFWGED